MAAPLAAIRWPTAKRVRGSKLAVKVAISAVTVVAWATAGGWAVQGEWAVREEWAVRAIVGERAIARLAVRVIGLAVAEEIALVIVVFQAVPGVEIAARLEAALASTAVALDPAAAGGLPALEVREAVVRGAVAVAGDNLTRRGENT
jgi:hypothetical protein